MVHAQYPEKGFLVILFVLNNGQIANIHPLYNFFDSPESASAYIEWMLRDIREKGEDVEVADVVSLIQLKLSKNISLEKSFIEKNNAIVSSSERASLFLPLIKKEMSDKILVIDNDNRQDKQHEYIILAPLNVEVSLDDAMQKVKFNDIKVIGKDRKFGLYDILAFKKLYWRTGSTGEN